MSKRSVLKKAVADKEQELEAIEKKLFRSQTVLLLALLDGKKPDKQEAEYFKMYAALIESGRKELQALIKELNDN